MKIVIINGPNLNLLGRREPKIYGSQSFEDYLPKLSDKFEGVTIEYFQSNIEGEIIDCIQQLDGNYDGALLNAGGYTHTSVSIADSVAAVETPIVEVHITSPLARERFRHISLVAPHVLGSIMGFGLSSYSLGVVALRQYLEKGKQIR